MVVLWWGPSWLTFLPCPHMAGREGEILFPLLRPQYYWIRASMYEFWWNTFSPQQLGSTPKCPDPLLWTLTQSVSGKSRLRLQVHSLMVMWQPVRSQVPAALSCCRKQCLSLKFGELQQSQEQCQVSGGSQQPAWQQLCILEADLQSHLSTPGQWYSSCLHITQLYIGWWYGGQSLVRTIGFKMGLTALEGNCMVLYRILRIS